MKRFLLKAALVVFGLAFGVSAFPTGPDAKTKQVQRYSKQCKRIGQKHCRVDAPGYSGRCQSKSGHTVIFYKSYPKKVKKIRCVKKFSH